MIYNFSSFYENHYGLADSFLRLSENLKVLYFGFLILTIMNLITHLDFVFYFQTPPYLKDCCTVNRKTCLIVTES